LYELCWCLYLCAKNENPSCAEEIINSLHLFICCVDFIYINVLAENRIDLINPKFVGVPKNWNTPDFNPSDMSSYCIIEELCKLTSAVLPNASSMKQNLWKDIAKRFFKTEVIIYIFI